MFLPWYVQKGQMGVCNYSYQLYLVLFHEKKKKKIKLSSICYLPKCKSLEIHSFKLCFGFNNLR